MFAYRLAYRLGFVNVDEMLALIEPWQMAEWMAAERLILEPDSWFRTGVVASTVHNEAEVSRAQHAGKSPRRSRIHDLFKYVPDILRRKRKQRQPDHVRQQIEKRLHG